MHGESTAAAAGERDRQAGDRERCRARHLGDGHREHGAVEVIDAVGIDAEVDHRALLHREGELVRDALAVIPREGVAEEFDAVGDEHADRAVAGAIAPTRVPLGEPAGDDDLTIDGADPAADGVCCSSRLTPSGWAAHALKETYGGWPPGHSHTEPLQDVRDSLLNSAWV